MDEVQLSRYERRKQRTRDALKAAAAAMLIEKGYEALTIQDITDHLDLARATFYVHFRDKDDMIWALLQDSFDTLTAQIHADLTEDLDERHYQKLLRLFRYVAEQRALLSMMVGDYGHIGLTRRLTQYLADIIRQDLPPGGTDQDRTFTAQFLAGAVLQVIVWWLDHPDAYTPEVMTAQFHALEMRLR